MMKPAATLAFAFSTLSTMPFMAAADAEVVADILPIHGLVSAVMDGVSEPTLLVSPGMDPHFVALKPSQARALNDAELVVWVGAEMTPWLDNPLETLTEKAHHLTLIDLPEGTITRLDTRSLEDFGEDAHEDHDDHAEDKDHGHGHDDHAEDKDHDHGHDDHAEDKDHDHGHDDHAEDKDQEEHAGHDDHGHHDHDGIDPHIWLSPANAKAFVGAIEAELKEIDPGHADAYASNAAALIAEIDAANAELMAAAASMDGVNFLVSHDSLAYLENAVGLSSIGALALTDNSAPSAAHIREITEKVEAEGVSCLFTDAIANTQLAQSILPENVKLIALDPLGSTVAPGPGHYPAMLRGIAGAFAECAG